MIVAHASAILEVLLNTPAGAGIARQILAVGQSVHVPHLIDVEILHVLRRLDRTGEIRGIRSRQIFQDYTDLPLNRYPHTILANRIWELRHNWTAYDAAYIALAEELSAPVLTRDRALATGPGHRAKVIVV